MARPKHSSSKRLRRVTGDQQGVQLRVSEFATRRPMQFVIAHVIVRSYPEDTPSDTLFAAIADGMDTSPAELWAEITGGEWDPRPSLIEAVLSTLREARDTTFLLIWNFEQHATAMRRAGTPLLKRGDVGYVPPHTVCGRWWSAWWETSSKEERHAD